MKAWLKELLKHPKLAWLAFWATHPRFAYDVESGYAGVMESYNPITGRCRVRWSHRGFITHEAIITRQDYETFVANCAQKRSPK